ncbi:DUF4124 domain-containing protein [Halomonas qinghailakensis]|uniref:DUF4124 domain-containing protein n=1 Tax=Halomonas qinghailakensis TaxID=2937790 RepID=A0AA46YRN2_9GAMM|nr:MULTISPECIES: DUF4124 domain-containing protein [Halomonas]UYO75788.1 DUF4124 domain-containing protein [Halomonas sp. ZZQ-149]
MTRNLRLQHKMCLSTGATLLLCLWVSAAQSQTVYRVVDEQGKVTFTDNPERGGEVLTLAPLPGVSTSLPPVATSSRRQGYPGQPFMPYDRFAIELPQAEASLQNDHTAVVVDVVPPLREDHRIQLLVNGEISQSALHSDAFWLAGLAAGQHQLQAELLDSDGRVQHRTDPVSIFIVD